MAECGQSIVFLIVFYIIAFIYVKEPHYKYFGYIMLVIVYLFSLGIMLQNTSAITAGFQPFKAAFLQNVSVKNVFMLFAFSIIVFNLYSLGRVVEAYWFKTKSMKSFDLKLSQRHKNNLRNFDNSFIVGNVAAALLLFSFVGIGDTGVEFIENIKIAMTTGSKPPIIFIQAFLFFISFVCVWVETTFSTLFANIKRD
jgi:hypothetical protein